MMTAVAATNVSCENYLDVNNNVDSPDYVDGYLYLSGIIQSMQGFYWDSTYATGTLTQMWSTTSQTSYALHRYPTGSDTGGEHWRMVYWNMGMNLENLINQSIEAENWTMAGIGLAIKAFSWDSMTKYNGDLPLQDAFVPGLLEHRYDYQDAVYEQVHAWALQAIEYLEMQDDTGYGSQLTNNDWIYFGDKSKWIKFCYSTLIRQLISLTNKSDFATVYGPELISYADKAFQSPDDDATVTVAGGSGDAPYSAYNNFWGTYRGNLGRSYFQSDYAVQVFTGTVRAYDENGNWILNEDENSKDDPRYKYALSEKQIICDTNVMEYGHYDPRVVVKLGTYSDNLYEHTGELDVIKRHKFYGGGSNTTASPIADNCRAPSFYGREASSSTVYDGKGRWLYHDEAPYILMTSSEIKFCLAEAYFRLGQKSLALQYWKDAIADDMTFTARYIKVGATAESTLTTTGGDKITTALFNQAAQEYLNGPFVAGVTVNDLTLSHIMMQKFVALYSWGSLATWVDMRKVFYDVNYTGEYPYNGNGWNRTELDQKMDDDPTKVYQGFYLHPARVEGKKTMYSDTYNLEGSPCFRIRPRYNSEYMWNKPSLRSLRPISGMTPYYQCSIPWFCYPGDYPESYPDVDNTKES